MIPFLSAEIRRPTAIHLPSTMNYFYGNCSDSLTQKEIRDNFITHLSQSRFRSLCIQYTDCTADNVLVRQNVYPVVFYNIMIVDGKIIARFQVTCGSRSSSNRRRRADSTHVITVKFDLVMRITSVDPNVTAQALWEHFDTNLNAMSDIIREEVLAGNFSLTVGNITTEVDVFDIGTSNIECGEGELAKPSFTCGKHISV